MLDSVGKQHLVSLGSLVDVNPESLPLGTDPKYTFSYLDIGAAANGKLSLPDDRIEFQSAPSRARLVVRSGDVLMSTVRPNLKAFAFCLLPPGDFVASTGFAVLRAKEGTDPRFILYSILSDDVSQQIQRYVVGSNYPAINSSDVRGLQVPSFSSAEQRSIGEILSILDEAIEQTEALIAKTQQIKAGLMHDLFTRGITPDGQLRPPREEAPQLYKESPPGWIPKEWDTFFLDDIAIRGSGHTPNKNHPEYWNGTIKWISLSDSRRLDRVHIADTDHRITQAGIDNSSAVIHPAGIVVLSRDAGVGKSAVTTCEMAVSQHFMCWRCGSRLNNYYLYYWLQHRKWEFENIATGSTIPTIGLRFFRHYRINAPKEVSEQVSIASALLAADDKVFNLEKELAKQKQLRAGLMQDLLTGRVRVRTDSSPEVTEVSANV